MAHLIQRLALVTAPVSAGSALPPRDRTERTWVSSTTRSSTIFQVPRLLLPRQSAALPFRRSRTSYPSRTSDPLSKYRQDARQTTVHIRPHRATSAQRRA